MLEAVSLVADGCGTGRYGLFRGCLEAASPGITEHGVVWSAGGTYATAQHNAGSACVVLAAGGVELPTEIPGVLRVGLGQEVGEVIPHNVRVVVRLQIEGGSSEV